MTTPQPAPVRPTKAFPKLCAEAASLITAPARLVALSHRDAPMGPLALRNLNAPNVPQTAGNRQHRRRTKPGRIGQGPGIVGPGPTTRRPARAFRPAGPTR